MKKTRIGNASSASPRARAERVAQHKLWLQAPHDLDIILLNIRNGSETSLATWQWRAKVPLIGTKVSDDVWRGNSPNKISAGGLAKPPP
jgi:hypothetical protein